MSKKRRYEVQLFESGEIIIDDNWTLDIWEGKFDQEDYHKLNQYEIYFSEKSTNSNRRLYIIDQWKKQHNLVKIILGIEKINHEWYVEYINEDSLDYRKSNIKINPKMDHPNYKRPEKGYYIKDKTYVTKININGKRYYLGNTKTENEAKKLYNRALAHYRKNPKYIV